MAHGRFDAAQLAAHLGRLDAASARLAADGDGVRVAVRDEGIGLPPGSAEAIFAPLARGTNALERQLPGLGLGLHICREIVGRHGGRLWAESAGERQGSTFHLWLPADADDALQDRHDADDRRARRVREEDPA